MIKRIVLTGGPCAGKTTVLSKIKQNLLEKGYKVFIVSESATELINGGITPHDDGVGMLDFQRLILLYQYSKEEIYNNALGYVDESDVVIIYDRALLDNRAYISNREFDVLLGDLSLEIGKKIDEFDILNRYDMVLHLVTSACVNGYDLSNNKARYESEKEAILLDKRIRDSWCMHSNFYVINSTTNFSEKVNNILSIVDSYLSSESQTKKKEKK